MARVKGLKILFLILAAMLVFSSLCIPASAEGLQVGLNLVPRNGKTILERGDYVELIILSPADFECDADNIKLSIGFDPRVFEVISSEWDVRMDGSPEYSAYSSSVTTVSGNTYFTIVAASGTFDIASRTGGMSVKNNPFKLTVTLRVKENTRIKNSELTFTTHDVWYSTGVTANAYEEMWGADKPTVSNIPVTISNLPSDSPVTGGGLTVDKTKVDRGDTVKVDIDIPAIAWDASPSEFTVDYDTEVYTLQTWNPTVGDKIISDGKFGARFSNERKDLDTPLHYEAVLKVKDNAPSKTTKFSLTPNIYDGTTAIWKPDPDKIELEVISTGYPYVNGGISSSATRVKRGDTVNIILTTESITAEAVTADALHLKTTFAKSAFDLVTIDGKAPGEALGDGCFTIDRTDVDLSAKHEYVAVFRAKKEADLRSYSFVIDEGYATKTIAGRTQTVWRPTATSTSIEVEVYDDFKAGGGISASDTQLDPGSVFDIIVSVPAEDIKADAVDFKITYDDRDFELTKWEPGIGATIINEPGIFGVKGTGLTTPIDLTSGKEYRATFRVKDTATKGSNKTFTLSSDSSHMSYRKLNGEYVTVWTPSPSLITAKVNILSDVTDFPKTSGGISLSKYEALPGETFNAVVTIPAMRAFAKNMTTVVFFDSNFFEIISVTPSNSAIHTEQTTQSFSGTLTNANLNLNGTPLTITASMRVKSTAPTDQYGTFRLDTAELYGTITTSELKQLWNPGSAQRSASLKVNSKESAYPITGGGITVSRSDVTAGGTFTLYINVPAINELADSLSIRVDFDPNVLEVVSWTPRVQNCNATAYNGYITLTGAGQNRYVDLSRGISVSANMRVKSTAQRGYTYIDLTDSNITALGIQRAIWIPSSYALDVYVNSSNYNPNNNNNNGNNWYNNTPYYDPWWKPLPTPPSNNNSNSNNGNGNTVGPGTGSSSGSNTQYIYDDDPIDSDDGDDGEDYVVINTGGNKEKPNIRLDAKLNNVIRHAFVINTKYRFFNGDTIVYIRNTDLAEKSADIALRNLFMSDRKRYAFDISVYDLTTGKYIHTLEDDGYIDIDIPIPNNFSSLSDGIVVYHTDNGYPEYIPSSIITDNGIKKIHFRATSFSPYMFVDTASAASPGGSSDQSSYNTPTTGGNNSNNYSSYTGSGNGGSNGENSGSGSGSGTGRPANPNTGSAILIVVIPAATLGCVVLSKKGKRKRSNRR